MDVRGARDPDPEVTRWHCRVRCSMGCVMKEPCSSWRSPPLASPRIPRREGVGVHCGATDASPEGPGGDVAAAIEEAGRGAASTTSAGGWEPANRLIYRLATVDQECNEKRRSRAVQNLEQLLHFMLFRRLELRSTARRPHREVGSGRRRPRQAGHACSASARGGSSRFRSGLAG